MKEPVQKILFAIALLCSCLIFSCDDPISSDEKPSSELRPAIETPDWAKNANIYEVNIRQFTPEGTFAAFQGHLPRLAAMGVKILWFMPIFPISEEKRKGSLGSYYAVSDFRKTNPSFGSIEDFKTLLQDIHERGMYLILDWVPNHTGWDHHWLTNHPDYYSKDANGQITDPINPATGESWGWTDVADLDYENPAMRRAMMNDMIFWTNEIGIDGFRMDVAHSVPDDFWDQVDSTLGSQGKPLFMLAESESPYHRNSGTFDMNYAWGLHHLINDIAQGEEEAEDLHDFLEEDRKKYSSGYPMYFTSNHDENTWAGTVFERMGDAHQALAVLCATLDGMPLIYGGQEEPLRKRLAFFEKDEIPWQSFSYAEFYATLLHEKLENQALWNGAAGGEIESLIDSDDVYGFTREKNGDAIAVILNLSDEPQKVSLEHSLEGYTDLFSKSKIHLPEDHELDLAPWAYQVYYKRP